jgi:hypothetical protein
MADRELVNVMRGVVSKNIIDGKSRYDPPEDPDTYIFRYDPVGLVSLGISFDPTNRGCVAFCVKRQVV